jgi:acyl-[acyl carrier protein]--UDP-N-acetylglucosamine O-acyltransferase
MKLSDFAGYARIERDAEFSRLGYVDSCAEGLLAYADSYAYLQRALINPHLAAIVTTAELATQADNVPGLLLAERPRDAFYAIHTRFIEEARYTYPFEPGIGKGCRIHPSAIIAPGCLIGDYVTIAEHVIIRDAVWIGSHVTIEPGAKLGMEGILYNMTPLGPRLIPHGGYVRIHDYAILMTNSTVVRSVHDTDLTEIGEAALIGLGSIVGHEAKIGARAVVSNYCVVARKSTLGDDVFLGTQAMVRENIAIGQGAKVMAGSIVIDEVAAGATVSGNFATNHRARMLEFVRATR